MLIVWIYGWSGCIDSLDSRYIELSGNVDVFLLSQQYNKNN